MNRINTKIIRLSSLLLFILSIYIHGQNFSLIDRAITTAIEDSVFPGAVVLVGNANKVLYKNSYGNFTYDSTSPQAEINSIYDMASVTKAFATTFCVMKLVDEGRLDIYKPVADYLPKFGVNGKENVKVIDLLIHESGLQAYYRPKEDENRKEILNKIIDLNLVYETGTKTKYSCLNFVTTMLIIESIINEPMYKFYADNFTTPLEMQRTIFNPNGKTKKSCVPTAPNLQGVVHDPLARGLDGLSGNAGLFSTVGDLSKLCQLLLNKGVYNNKRYLSRAIVNLFTKQYSPQSSRAIGFDTRSEGGKSSSGKYFCKGTYGHLGFTGTSIWIDPVRKIYAILLTNRVYPDERASIRSTRPKVYDAVILSLEDN